ncbi:MAG: glycosyltransferase family 2 protein [Candidatus Aureabacteria bacterium]|nr:glycosyltransferase family 2 protein [Candidatus Auribacterota bacterium]
MNLQFLFWMFIFLVVFPYLGYPLLLNILTLMPACRKPAGNKGSDCRTITLVVPAYNEENIIKQKVSNILDMEYPRNKMEVLIVLDGCTDNTKSIISGFNSDLIKVFEQNPRKGKIAALNKAVELAQGEILVFSDANSLYDRDALKKIESHFEEKNVGCVCGKLKYMCSDGTSVESGENIYWKYEEYLKERESILGSLLVTNGSIYAMRKSLYSKIAGDIADDFVNPMRVYNAGYKVIYEPGAIAREKVSSNTLDQFNQKIRIIAQGWKATFKIFNVIFSSGFLRITQFLCHKLLRWLTPFFLTIIFVLNLLLIGTNIYTVLLVVQLVLYVFALVGFLSRRRQKPVKIFYIPFYLCLINSAAFMAFFRFLIGFKTDTWEKSETSRNVE